MGGISAGKPRLTTRMLSLAGLLLGVAAPLSAQVPATAYRNTLSVLTAATIVEDDVGATFGLAYEHRLGKWYGVGAFADYLTTSDRNVVLAVSFHLHPTSAIRVQVAPGVDFRRVGADLVMLRMGVAYKFPLGQRWALSPEVNIDFEGGYRIFVVGLSWGWRF